MTAPKSAARRHTALVTGASKGLGRALAERLARDGWALVLDARGADALAETAAHLAQIAPGAVVRAVPGDVTDPAHRRALAEAARALGGLDLVVNNAGALGPSPQPALLDYPLETLARVFEVNVLGPLGVIQAVRETLAPAATIVNVTSDAAVETYAGWGGYGASKAALEHLSRVLAVEHPTLEIYCVDPGDMRTDMHQAAFPGEDIGDREPPAASVPGILALVAGTHPSGRYRARDVPAGPGARARRAERVS